MGAKVYIIFHSTKLSRNKSATQMYRLLLLTEVIAIKGKFAIH